MESELPLPNGVSIAGMLMNDAPLGGRAIEGALRENIPALVAFYDAQRICRFANDHHAVWYNREPDSFLGLHIRDLVGAETYDGWMPFIDRVESGDEVAFDARHPHRSGWRETRIRFVPRLNGSSYEGFHAVVFDASLAHHRFQNVFNVTAVGFWELAVSGMAAIRAGLAADPEGFRERIANDYTVLRTLLDDCAVIDLNVKACKMLGIPRDAAIGRPFGSWIPDSELGTWSRNILSYLDEDESFEAESAIVRDDGSRLDVLLSRTLPRKSDQHDLSLIGLVDISQRVAKEAELAQAESKLAHAARIATLGELTASIAHEVNQPLAAIVANGNAALRWLERSEPDVREAEAAIERIVREGARASDVISRIRRMALKDGGARSPLNLHQMIAEAMGITRRQVTALGATIALDLRATDPFVSGDYIQLQQVIINLVINAAQAMMKQAGRRRVSIVSSDTSSEISIDVTDTGPGISSEMVDRVFDAFFTTKSDGMGMGLSIANTIIKAHGGTITIIPPVDHGASFHIVLPRHKG